MQRLLQLPFFVILMGIGALSMYIPALHGFTDRNYSDSRIFFYSGTFFLLIAVLVGVATAANAPSRGPRNQLLTLLGAYTVLPLLFAVPFREAVQDTTFFNAWWEMVSSFTTTGASLYDPPRLAPTLHLWRALVGWMGGFFVLLTAIAILAPMNLGGFEVMSASSPGQGAAVGALKARAVDPSERVRRYFVTLFPAYTGLTLILWVALLMAGDPPLVASTHAMSTLSTSGISAVGGTTATPSGLPGEVAIFCFLIFALSRQLYPSGRTIRTGRALIADPELKMALLLVTVVPTLLFVRHWVGAVEVDVVKDAVAAARALWGTVFTVLSFLTTTGFESTDWAEAQAWSGLGTPGLILAGLAVIGGGVATTAGGVKLLRVYALYRHGEREIEQLVHPNSVGGAGEQARRLRNQGAQIAWIFFMLFALSIAVTMLGLSLTGLNFEASTIFSVAALSNTGPLAAVAADQPLAWAKLDNIARTIAAAAMVLGRLETLAIIALLNPEFWRS